MDNIVLTSIIAAAAACLGALIPSVFSYLGKKEEYVLGRLAKIDDVSVAFPVSVIWYFMLFTFTILAEI